MRHDWGLTLLPPAAALVIRVLHATLRTRHWNAAAIDSLNERGLPYILSFWHSDLLLMVYSRYRKPIRVMSSQHRDGEIMVRTLRRFGVSTARGSSTRGGQAALREMIRMARAGERLAFTPDGPTGPRRIAKPGVIQAAQLSGLPIIPAAIVAERRRLLDSWDRFQIPRPFSRTLYLYEDPIEVPRNLSPEGFEAKRLELEKTMHELVRKGEEEFAPLWKAAER
jgi:lysophospholipid acyltransferase (LPLAT)-like uncharacterized protein